MPCSLTCDPHLPSLPMVLPAGEVHQQQHTWSQQTLPKPPVSSLHLHLSSSFANATCHRELFLLPEAQEAEEQDGRLPRAVVSHCVWGDQLASF